MSEPKAEVVKRFFVTGVGHVTVNNYGVVKWDTQIAPTVLLSIEQLREISREVREAVTQMKSEGSYAR